MTRLIKLFAIVAALAVPSVSTAALDTCSNAWNTGYNTMRYFSSAGFNRAYALEKCSLEEIESTQKSLSDLLMTRLPPSSPNRQISDYEKSCYFSGMFDGFVTSLNASYKTYCADLSISDDLLAYAAENILFGMFSNLRTVYAANVTKVLTCDYGNDINPAEDALVCDYAGVVTAGENECRNYLNILAEEDGILYRTSQKRAAADAVCLPEEETK